MRVSAISFISLLIIVNMLAISTSAIDPYETPTIKSTHFNLNPKNDPTGLPWDVDVYAPSNAANTSVLLFLSGLNGNIPSSFYSDMLTRMSESGDMVVLAINAFPSSPFSNRTAQMMRDLMEWVWDDGLTKTLIRQKLNSSVDPMKLVGCGHSEGAKAPVIVALNQTLHDDYPRLSALVLLDPVDGDPFNKSVPVIQPNSTLPFVLPSAVIVSGLGDIPGLNIPGYPACVPKALGGDHFYGALQPPKWFLNATDYGHADALNPLLARGAAFSHFCKSCNASVDPGKYSQFLGAATAGFVSAVIDGDMSSLPYIQDPSLMPIRVVATRDVGIENEVVIL